MAPRVEAISVDTPAELAVGHDVLRVTTFNVLAPVWTHANVYPSMDMAFFDPATRRRHQFQKLLELQSDVVMMQEVQKTELDLLLDASGGLLREIYDVEFCAFGPSLWKNWLTEVTDFKPREIGVAVLTKRSAVEKLRTEKVSLDGDAELPENSRGAYASFVWARVPRWNNATVLIVASHLDMESFFRARTQSRQLAEAIRETIDRELARSPTAAETVIWGGDFNMEERSPCFKAIERLGFRAVSGSPKIPSAFTVYWTVRLDHILIYQRDHVQPVETVGTFVPSCPVKGRFSVLPFTSELHWLTSACLGYGGALRRALALCLTPLASVLACPAAFCALDRKRNCESLRWALEHWGSDHLPVTVALRRAAATEVSDCGNSEPGSPCLKGRSRRRAPSSDSSASTSASTSDQR
mmetsp:Transcript_101420/g.286102  ORF Transcript_101420/g.286102 Transcript_101420/m.286102 type:complete len:412 (+) Transcript_101420:58-1293(+)